MSASKFSAIKKRKNKTTSEVHMTVNISCFRYLVFINKKKKEQISQIVNLLSELNFMNGTFIIDTVW